MAREVCALSENKNARNHRLFIDGQHAPVVGEPKRSRWLSGSAQVQVGQPASGHPADGIRFRRRSMTRRSGCHRGRCTDTDPGRQPQVLPWVRQVAASPAQKRRSRSLSHRHNCSFPRARYPVLALE